MKTARIGLRIKLPAFLIGLSLVTAAAIGITDHVTVSSGLVDQARDNLRHLSGSQATAIEVRFSGMRRQIAAIAGAPHVAQALRDLGAALATDADRQAVRKFYRDDDRRTQDERILMAGSTHDHDYSRAHQRLHPTFRDAMLGGGFADILLIDTKGQVVYSVGKGKEFGETLAATTLQKTALAQIVASLEHGRRGQQAFADFAPYELSQGEARAFVAEPVFLQEAGGLKRVGSIVFTFGPGAAQETLMALTNAAGAVASIVLDSKGTVLTASDYAPRPLLVPGALTVRSDDNRYTVSMPADLQNEILAHATPVKVFDATWVMVSTERMSTALAIVSTMRTSALVSSLITMVPLCLLATATARSISRPIWAWRARSRKWHKVARWPASTARGAATRLAPSPRRLA